jgi:hypothetical protein
LKSPPGNKAVWREEEMRGTDENKGNLKQKVLHEFKVYLFYVIYLALVFAAFTHYRRLILADVGLVYTNYGVALIEALIFAKVIMIGDVLRLGRMLENKPLILPTLIKTVLFTIFVGLFTLLEHAAKGLIKGKGAVEGILEFLEKGPYELLAGALVLFVAFIPFFTLRELARALGGEGKVLNLLLKSRPNP